MSSPTPEPLREVERALERIIRLAESCGHEKFQYAGQARSALSALRRLMAGAEDEDRLEQMAMDWLNREFTGTDCEVRSAVDKSRIRLFGSAGCSPHVRSLLREFKTAQAEGWARGYLSGVEENRGS